MEPSTGRRYRELSIAREANSACSPPHCRTSRGGAGNLPSSFSSRCGHKRILSHSACALGGVSHTMRKGNSNLVHALLALRSRLARYHPEKHYMRGPGPKTLSKLGDAYRAQAAGELEERVPDEWLALIRSIRDRERNG